MFDTILRMRAIEIAPSGSITIETGFIHSGTAQSEESKQRSIAFLRSEIKVLPSVEYLQKFEPNEKIIPIDKLEAQYHQRDHAGHVLVLTTLYLKRLQGRRIISVSDREIEALGWTAVYHDCMRVDDGEDASHGERAAHAIEENVHGFFDAIEGDIRPLVCRIIREHVPNDAQDMHPLSRIFKDMDNMLWIRTEDLDTQFLRIEEALDMLPIAHALLDETEKIMKTEKDGFKAVLIAATRLGIIDGQD